MTLAWVEDRDPLPDPARAPVPASGLAAAGLDLSPARLAEAYRKGLFPWYGPGEPVLWWSPDPRMVLRCEDFRVSRSLAKRVRQFDRAAGGEPVPEPATGSASESATGSASESATGSASESATGSASESADRPPRTDAPPALCVTLNLAFPEVIARCARRGAPRIGLGAARAGRDWAEPGAAQGRDATWITPDIMAVYTAWHRMGRAHSVETWIGGRLAGGLYGVGLGQCFFGESMFSLAADASKVALAYLVRHLLARGASWIDCQQETPHLASLGARPVPRARFLEMLAAGRDAPAPPWERGRLRADGGLEPPPAGWRAR
ncbi:leucyl/phenylalanyl-tRNA--protein transferase [Castellaniella defragrans]|uniref:Leucyl/phenylalanyl-tRNA--protein transferase n=2 Tax=Castellaniella defragrans TaxID=75697 RepID=A0A7W9WLD5_CASDE|nr:leucyl/phenylalanyl-tRNA--protein transferase [Castellaniella defragrans]MBB6083167.1 leucyl/phenylalanyl-tRNA--protein transferase [Castellaniella defragrans]